jgi:hypothetical protein
VARLSLEVLPVWKVVDPFFLGYAAKELAFLFIINEYVNYWLRFSRRGNV